MLCVLGTTSNTRIKVMIVVHSSDFIVKVTTYFTLPNSSPGQSYLVLTFVPARMPLLGSFLLNKTPGHLLIFRKIVLPGRLFGPGLLFGTLK